MTAAVLKPSPRNRAMSIAAVLASLLLAAPGAHASESEAPAAKGQAGHASKDAAAHGMKAPTAAKAAKALPAAKDAKALPAAAEEPADPIDRLQQRLAERLGARTAPDSPGPYDVHISTRAVAAKPAPRPAVRRPAVNVAALAAARSAPLALTGHGGVAGGMPGGATHWGYTGDAGPHAWSAMKPEFEKCGSGTRQSPIDIRGGLRLELEPIQFEYRATGFSVLDNGHTVQVNLPPGNSIQVQGRRFDLLQFHFHRPSEERIDGRQFDMVAHLVHKDPEGRLAVVAVLLDRGSAQPVVQAIWNNLPLEKGEELPARVSIDLNRLLPEDRRYYTYMGSLTTPPCDEGVLWLVMQQPVPISPEQVGVFSRLYPMNARPVQPTSGRLIKQSN